MKKVIVLCTVLLASLHANAQLVWLEGGLEILSLKQNGTLFIADTISIPNIREEKIDQGMSHFGIVAEVFYPINQNHETFERFSTGLVFGFSLTNGWRKTSVDPGYKPQPEKFFNNGTGNLRIPLLWSVRFGNMRDPEAYTFGLELAVGMHLFHFDTANERGWATLPGGKFTAQYKGFGLSLIYYPVSYNSYYNFPEGEALRLKNTPFTMEFKYSFPLFLGPVD